MNTQWRNRILGVLVPVLLLCTWEFLARTDILPPSLTAPPSAVAIRLVELIANGQLLRHGALSIARLFAGVAIGSALGVVTALIVFQFGTVDRLLTPFLQFVSPIPVVVWIPLVITLLGADEAYKIGLTCIVAFLVSEAQAIHSMRNIDRQFIELAAIYEKSKLQQVKEVLLPSALPHLLAGLRITFALGWVVVFFAEYGSARLGAEGLGWFIADARAVGIVENEYAGVTLLAVLGYATDATIIAFRNRWIGWARSVEVSVLERS